MLLLLLAGMIGQQDADPMQQVEYVRLSYKANKDAFAFGTFRFEYTIGVSTSRSDSESGVFTESIQEDGFYVFDGKNARYELTADPKAVAAVTRWIGERSRTSIAFIFRMLTDGKVTFLDALHADRAGTILINQPVIFRGARAYHQRFDFPLSLGIDSTRSNDLFWNLTRLKKGEVSLAEFDPDSRLNGHQVCKISLDYKDGKYTYWVQPESRFGAPSRPGPLQSKRLGYHQRLQRSDSCTECGLAPPPNVTHSRKWRLGQPARCHGHRGPTQTPEHRVPARFPRTVSPV